MTFCKPETYNPEKGGCENGWICEHRWTGIKNLPILRAAMNKVNTNNNKNYLQFTVFLLYILLVQLPVIQGSGKDTYENWWDNGFSKISFSRGDGYFVMGPGGHTLNKLLQTGLEEGEYCNLGKV